MRSLIRTMAKVASCTEVAEGSYRRSRWLLSTFSVQRSRHRQPWVFCRVPGRVVSWRGCTAGAWSCCESVLACLRRTASISRWPPA